MNPFNSIYNLVFMLHGIKGVKGMIRKKDDQNAAESLGWMQHDIAGSMTSCYCRPADI